MNTQNMWNLIGRIFYFGFNRVKLGDNHSIHNWMTIGDRQSYRQANIKAFDELRALYAHTFWHGELNIKQMLSIKSFYARNQEIYSNYGFGWMGRNIMRRH